MHRNPPELTQILALTLVAFLHSVSMGAESGGGENEFWQAYGLKPAVKIAKEGPDSSVLRVAMRSRDESSRIVVFDFTENTAVFVTKEGKEIVRRDLNLTERQWSNIGSMPGYVDIKSLASEDPYEPSGLDGPDCLVEWITNGKIETLHRSMPFVAKKIRKTPNHSSAAPDPFASSKDMKFIEKDAGDERINVLLLYTFAIAGIEPFM